MAQVRPFRGIRYNADKIGASNLHKVVAPPYDVIDEAGQAELYAAHPNNIVRMDLNKERATDDAANNRYTRARRHLMDWLADGVLRQDHEPAFYVHHQIFQDEAGHTITRRGFLGRIRLATYDEKVVLPHERTLRGPKVDRLALMNETECNLSPVFLLYDDADGAVDGLFEDAIGAEAGAFIETADGIRHKLWPVHDSTTVARVEAFFESQAVLIADGHHRYETAIAYRDERRAKAETAVPDAPYEFAMAFFANVHDPGLIVWPTHRVVHDVAGFDYGTLLAGVTKHAEFEVATTELDDGLRDRLATSGETAPSFVVLGHDQPARLVRWVGGTESPLFDAETPAEVRALDVAILHEVILDRVLGISKAAQEAKTNLHYLKTWDGALSMLSEPGTQLVVLMNPTPVAQVDSVCRSGGVMPQKSTFFYPKVLSGLLINPV